MYDFFHSRAESFGRHILENNTTIRKTAERFGISKSTVHNDISNRLKYINYSLYLQVKDVLDNNFNEKHIRGGMATKLKYLKGMS